MGAVAMFLPGIGLFTWKEVQQVTGWDTLMVIGGVTSLGQASSQTGLATWLAESALGGLADWNAVALIAAISAFTVGHPPHAAYRPGHQRRDDPADHGPRRGGRRESGPLRAAGHLHRVVRLPTAPSTPCPWSPTAGATTGCSTCCRRAS